ncbi:MAG: proteasome ATPase [Nitriliruptorales bacterium]|nr:proteasome ATPase [Nitriliruptorales bacterium]
MHRREGGFMADPQAELNELRTQVAFLEEETVLLRRRLEDSPSRVRALEERLLETKGQLAAASAQNSKLADTLREARDQIVALKQQVEKLSAPPSGYGVFLGIEEEGTVEVFAQGRKLRVNISPEIDVAALTRGQEVLLNEALNVIEAAGYEVVGEVMTLKERMEGDRLLVIGHTDDEQVVRVSDPLTGMPLRAGDSLLVDSRSGHALERLPRPEVEELILEEVPDIAYDDIGGLTNQIEAIQDAVELPFLHADLFLEHQLKPPKGILLYGPPGCGKTMIAKAVANSLAKRVAEKEGRADARSYFLNIKGPELLNKYVGETERQIRLIFQRAREKVEEGFPVIVFFDEMDSIFRTRGSGVSSDVETTIVPQLLSEIDGVETLKDVIVIGASNREDMIDPAILRPGRLDVKIKIERPDQEAAKEIFGIYLHKDLPLHPDMVKEHGGEDEALYWLIIETCARMYAEIDENRFLEVTYANGDKEILHFKDFNSGAMIENVVARAKKMAIKRFLNEGQKGIKPEDLFEAIRDEFKENEDLPNTTNPDDWARISGKKGERIVYVRTLIGDGKEPGKSIESVNTGQYL